MREIKFRAFNTLTKTMHDIISIWHNQDGSIAHVVIPLNEDHTEVDTLFNNFELMQFTSLMDSNGKNIFEGDIILQKSKEGWHSKVEDYFFIEFGRQDLGNSSYQQTIGWNATHLRSFSNEDRTLRKGINDLCINHIGITAVVIGNIHENKELLR